jgi:hypothetical protein
MFEVLENWYDAHPDATFAEIEQHAREQRRQFMGETLEILINQRAHNSELNAPVCPKCGCRMKLHETRGKTVHGLEGRTRVERSYYVCSAGCGQTAFPPGSVSATAERSVE